MPEGVIRPCSSKLLQRQHQDICNEITQVITSNVESNEGTQIRACHKCGRCTTSLESLLVEIGETSSWSNRIQDIQPPGRNVNYLRRLIQAFGLFDMCFAIWHLILLYISTIQLPPYVFTASTIWRFIVDPVAFIGLLVFAELLLLGLESESNEKKIWHSCLWIYFQPLFLLYSIVDLLYVEYPRDIDHKYYYVTVNCVLLSVRLVVIILVKYFMSQMQSFD